MDFHTLTTQRRTHPAWRLLAADNAPMIASFLHRSFVTPNPRTIARQQLASELGYHLYHLRQQAGDVLFQKARPVAPSVTLPMDRTLCTPPSKPTILQRVLDADGAPVPSDALFEQVYVARQRMLANVHRALQNRQQITPRWVVGLMQGVLYREQDSALWQSLLLTRARATDHSLAIGLDLVLVEAEGYAYLRQRPTADGEVALPRLVPRRQLSYPVSLFLVLLRKKLVEFDASAGETRLIAIVDAQWLCDFDQRLADYGSHAGALAGDEA